MDGFVFLNGTMMPANEAMVSVFDLGFLRGMGAFETLRTYNGNPFALSDHMARLWASTQAFSVDACFDEAYARQAIAELYTANNKQDMRVNFLITPGQVSADGISGTGITQLIIGRPHHAADPEQIWKDGLHAVSFRGKRILPRLKTTNYLSGHKGQEKAKQHQAHEAFYVNDDGEITEGVTSNILVFRDKHIICPSAEKLNGITQQHILNLADKAGFSNSVQACRPQDLLQADGVCICSSVREMLPVVSLDGETINTGQAIPACKDLAHQFHSYCVESAAADAQS